MHDVLGLKMRASACSCHADGAGMQRKDRTLDSQSRPRPVRILLDVARLPVHRCRRADLQHDLLDIACGVAWNPDRAGSQARHRIAAAHFLSHAHCKRSTADGSDRAARIARALRHHRTQPSQHARCALRDLVRAGSWLHHEGADLGQPGTRWCSAIDGLYPQRCAGQHDQAGG